MRFLRQATSVDVAIGPFLDSSDGVTAEDGLSITQPDIRLKKNNGNWAQKAAAQTLSHEEGGWYELSLDENDTDTLGVLMVSVRETGALPVWHEFSVLPANVYDSLFSTDKLEVDLTQINGVAQTATLDTIKSDTGEIGVAGAGLTDIPWNSDWDAEVQSEAADALNAYDPPTHAELTSALGNLNDLDAAGVRAAVGLASANLDTQLGAIDSVVDDILVDTGTTLQAELDGIQADTEDIQSRIPAALVSGRMDVSVGAYQTGLAPLQPTVAGRTLDVSTGGEAGIDWSNIGAPTTTVTLSGTTVKTATEVETDTQDIQSRLPAALVDGRIDANVGAISGSSLAADNVEVVFATDFSTNYDATRDRWQVDVDLVNTDALGSDGLADSAVTEITSGIGAAVITALQNAAETASASMSYASADVDVANLALDILREAPITSFSDGTPEADWLARNYATARDAELREHPWKFAIKRKKLLPHDYLLHGLSGTLSGAWAPFKVTEDYSGDLLTIRRSFDDATDDFTVADGSILVDTGAIGTFVGSGSGYVASFFDQSGNGRELAQATSTKQPAFSAEVADANGAPAAALDGTDDLLATSGALSDLISTSAGYIVIAGLINTLSLDSATPDANHLLIGDAAQNIGLYVRKGGTLYGMNADSGGDDSVTDNVPTLVPFVAELRHVDSTLYTRVNMTAERSVASGTTVSLAGALNVGDLAAGSQALDFNLFAVLTFSTPPTAAERDRLAERLMRMVGAGGLADFGWRYRYQVPTDCLRMLPLTRNGEFDGDPIPHEVNRGYVLTNQPTAIHARYIQQFTDASQFDPLFKEALSAKLALKMAHWLTGKASMAETAMSMYERTIARAKRANAFEGTPESQYGQDVINVRY